MGSSSSIQSQDRMSKLLIGNHKNKSEMEQNFYKLSLQFLEKGLQYRLEKLDLSGNQSLQSTAALALGASSSEQEGTSTQKKPDFPLEDTCNICNHNNSNICKHSNNDEGYVFNSSGSSLFLPLSLTKKLSFTQTYIQWKASYDMEKLSNLFNKTQRVIYLVQLNDLPSFVNEFIINVQSSNYNLTELITNFLQAYFCGMTIKWLPTIDIAQTNWSIKSRYHDKTDKLQYLVTDFYIPLQRRKPKNGYCIMGMSWTDLYPKEELNFVLGEASNHHKSGVFSFGRFEPKTFFEGQKDITQIDADVLWKLLKVVSHELCHLFGLSHCEYFLCAMNQSSSVLEALSQPLFLCPVCIRKLQHVCKFDILERYNQLKTIIDSIQMQMPNERWNEAANWLRRCHHFLINGEEVILNKQIESTKL